MKFGAHSYLFTDRWSDSQVHLLDLSRELGLQMFELSVGDDILFTHRLTRDRAASLGIDLMIGPGGIWPLECDLSADDPVDRAKGVAWHKRQVDVAAAIGAVAYAGALYGHPGVVKRRRPPHDELSWTAEGLHALAEYAEEQQVILALEPMSHFRTHLINTPDQLMRLIQLADHRQLRVLFDTYHVITEIRSYTEAIHTVGPLLYALHACENDRGVPGGGIVPWESIFEMLREVGFDGYVGLEGYNSSIGDFAYQRGMFHNVCPDGPAFVRQGIGFLKDMYRKVGREV